MVNTYHGHNRFQTYVECVLEKRRGETREFAYLSSRCRPESISHEIIFNRHRYSFSVVQSWKGEEYLTFGSAMCSRNFTSKQAPSFTKPGSSGTHVHVDMIDVELMTFDETLAYLQNDTLSNKSNRLFMRISWKDANDNDYVLHSPCSYTNFPNPESDWSQIWQDRPAYPKHHDRYIQPIRGIVIYFENGGFIPAFVSAHINSEGTQRIEFCLRDCLSFFLLRRPTGIRGKLMTLIANSWIGRYFMVSEFHRIVTVSGKCEFYLSPAASARLAD